MANIEQDLQAIMQARYGRDVRQSIHDAIYDINDVNEANISTVQGIADTAQGYANTALQAKNDAQTAKTGAETAQTNASNSAKDAEAWAVGKRNGTDVPSTDPTYENNSKYWQERANYWYEQAKSIAESFSGALRPMGTVTFANLPPVSQATAGDMYNVSDEFTTTSDFVEGAGIVVPLGSNVYLTTNSKWDILAGSPVTGVKGSSENSYRRGNVSITKANIGLGNVDNTADADKPISTAQQSMFDDLTSNVTPVDLTPIWFSNSITNRVIWLYRVGKIVYYNARFSLTADRPANEGIFEIPNGVNGVSGIKVDQTGQSQNQAGLLFFVASGSITTGNTIVSLNSANNRVTIKTASTIPNGATAQVFGSFRTN